MLFQILFIGFLIVLFVAKVARDHIAINKIKDKIKRYKDEKEAKKNKA